MPDLVNRLKWHLNRRMGQNLWFLNLVGGRLTIISMFRSPGDTLLTGSLCRIIKAKHPRLRLNCQVEQPELLELDPSIDGLNQEAGPWTFHFEYLDLLSRKDGSTNILAPAMRRLGIRDYKYKCAVFITENERTNARRLVGKVERPMITINVMSRERMKIWGLESWRVLIAALSERFTIVQLGDKSEPCFENVLSFAGKLSLRESMAVLSLARMHIGPDSFLMHAANGLDVPSVIIFGGSRTDRNLGYSENINLCQKTDCSPCWLHSTKGDVCGHGMKCMELITPEMVLGAVDRLEARMQRPGL
jgi:hypothetical protein